MDKFTFDFSNFDQVDWNTMPEPQPLPLRTPRILSHDQLASLKSALHFSSLLLLSEKAKLVEEVIGVGERPPPSTLVAPPTTPPPAKFRIPITYSKSSELTVGLAAAVSGAAVFGMTADIGVYGSSTREIGVFVTAGVGVWVNTPGGSAGIELTFVKGTPVDFSGLFFGLGIGFGTGIGVTGTLLFSPTMVASRPVALTLMGVSLNVSAVTPTRLPVTVSFTITNTAIRGIKI